MGVSHRSNPLPNMFLSACRYKHQENSIQPSLSPLPRYVIILIS